MTEQGVPVLPPLGVPVAELAELYSLDTDEYGHTFFPEVISDKTPGFHLEIDAALEDPRNRHVAIEVFRGGAKTTKLLIFTSKRIAYGNSRTILYVSSAQAHAVRCLTWLRKQVEYNKKWTDFYQLEKGDKWTDEWIEIRHRILGISINIVASGMTGQIRGLNINGRRPDLIVVDDPDDEETTGTPEQRKKVEDRFFGAIEKSLVPRSENPDAKMVLLQTSLHKEDLINKCHKDSTWITKKFSCFDEAGVSRWPARWTTEELVRDKQGHIDRGQILLWLREMECTIGDEETADFKGNWLRYWELLPEKMIVVMSIDPAPPPSAAQLRSGLRHKDSEVITAQGVYRGEFYLLEQRGAVDHDPEWTATNFFAMALHWRPLKTRVETIGYQQTLKYLLEKEMQKRKQYFLIEEYRDQRKKRHRILDAFSGIASQGHYYVNRTHQKFIEQFSSYPSVEHDDYVDSAAIGLDALLELSSLADDEGLPLDDSEVKKLAWSRPAP